MKNRFLTKLLLPVFFIFSVIFFSCSMAEDVFVTTSGNRGGFNNLTGYLYDSPEAYEHTVSSNSRSILSDAEDTEYDYYIYGTTPTGMVRPIEKLTVNGGIFSINLEPYTWELTVFAIKSGETLDFSASQIRSKALLVGYSVADLSYSSASVTFILSTKTLIGTGSINFDVVLSDDGGVTTWENGSVYGMASIQNLVTGEVVNFEDGTSSEKRMNFIGSSAHYGDLKKLQGGTYNFVINFFDSNDKSVGSWSDILSIVTGRNITQDVYVPKIIGTAPVKPASFKAAYVTGSEDSAKHEGFYKVHFNWENTPVNENYYEIQIADITGRNSYALNDTIWESLEPSRKTVYGKNFSSMDGYDSGSTLSNNTDLTVYLELGRQYQARIRAVNSCLQGSDWEYVMLPVSGISYAAEPLSYFVPNGSSTAAKTINRFRILYNLNGGSYKISEHLSTTVPKVVYDVQYSPVTGEEARIDYWDGTGYDPLDPATNLRNGSQILDFWSVDMLGNTASSGFTYGYRNETIFAQYKPDPSGSSGDSTVYRFLAKWVSSFVAGDSSTSKVLSSSETATVGAVIVSKAASVLSGTGKSIVNFTVEIPSGANPGDFNNLVLKVYDQNNNPVSSQSIMGANMGGISSFDAVDITAFENGAYPVKIIAEKRDGSISIFPEINITLVVID